MLAFFKVKPKYKEKAIFKLNGHTYEFGGTSLFLLGARSKFRFWFVRLIANKWFDNFFFYVSFLNASILGFVDYRIVGTHPNSSTYYQPLSRGSWRNSIYNYGNIVCPILFLVEAVCKIIAMGFFFGKGNLYFHDNWNKFDFCVVIISIVVSSMPGIPSYTNILISVFRMFKSLTLASQLAGLQRLTQSILRALPGLGSTLLFLLFIFGAFSVLGLTLFCNTINAVCRITPFPVLTTWDIGLNYTAYRCLDASNFDLPSPSFLTQADSPWNVPQDCYWPTDDNDQRPCAFPGTAGNHLCLNSESAYPTWCGSNWDVMGNPRFKGETTLGMYGDYYFTHEKLMSWGTFNSNMNYGYTTFDNIFRAFVTTFECITFEGYSYILYLHRDSNNPFLSAAFFICIAFLGACVLCNLVLAVLGDHFHPENNSNKSNSAEIIAKTQSGVRVPAFQFIAKSGTPMFTEVKSSSRVFRFVHSQEFEMFVTLVVLLNTAVMASDHYPSTSRFDAYYEKVNFACTVFFGLDFIFRFIALGLKEYCQDSFNLLDGFIVALSIIELAIAPPAFLSGRTSHKKGLSALRALRILRSFKLAKKWKSMRVMLTKIGKTLPDLGNMLLLLFIFIYALSLIGMQVFANRFCFDSLGFPIALSHPNWSNGWRPRAHYDDLLWGMFTTFNIMTGENWNSVMYDGWRSTSTGFSFIFFLLVVVMGQMIGMELLLTILLCNFEGEEPEIESEQENGSIQRSNQEKRASLLSLRNFSLAHTPTHTNSQSPGQQKSSNTQAESAMIFKPLNRFQRICAKIICHPHFERVILVFIIVSCACLALEDPLMNPQSRFIANLEKIDLCLTLVFVVEIVLKSVALGFIFQNGAYMRSPWNILDFVVVPVSLLSYWFNGNLKFFRVLRALRAFRPLRLIHRLPSLKRIVKTIFAVIPGVFDVIAITIFFLFAFGCLGVSLFKGDLRYCALGFAYSPGVLYDPVSNNPNEFGTLLSFPKSWIAMNETERSWFGPENPFVNASFFPGNCSSTWPQAPCCPSWPQDLSSTPSSRQICECWGSTWDLWWGYWNFDNILHSVLAFFQISSTDGWVLLMLACIDANGINMQPIRNNNLSIMVLFVVFIMVMHYFAFHLLVAVIFEHYNKEADSGDISFLTEDQKAFVKTQKIIGKLKLTKKQPLPKDPVSCFFFAVVSAPLFDMFMMGCLFCNMVVMALQHKTQSHMFSFFLEVANYFFSGIFTVELICKLIALKKTYFEDKWNCFDCLVVIAVDLAIIVQVFTSSSASSIALLIRVIKVGRMFRLMSGSLTVLFDTLISSIIAVVNIGALLLLIIFIFALLGNQLFAKVAWPDLVNSQLNYYYNFQTFQNSIVTLFAFAAGEFWDGFSMALGSHTPDCVHNPPYNPNMCGFSSHFGDTPENGCEPLNGCGNWGAILFMCLYFFIVSMVLLNLFVGIIIDRFDDLKPDESFLTQQDIELFNAHWVVYDPDSTYFINYLDLIEFMSTIEPPWKIVATGPKELHQKTVSWKLKIYKGNTVHFYDVAYAMSMEIMKQKLNGIKLDRKLEVVLKEVRGKPSIQTAEHEMLNGVEIQSIHNYAALIIQQRLKRNRAPVTNSKKLTQPTIPDYNPCTHPEEPNGQYDILLKQSKNDETLESNPEAAQNVEVAAEPSEAEKILGSEHSADLIANQHEFKPLEKIATPDSTVDSLRMGFPAPEADTAQQLPSKALHLLSDEELYNEIRRREAAKASAEEKLFELTDENDSTKLEKRDKKKTQHKYCTCLHKVGIENSTQGSPRRHSVALGHSSVFNVCEEAPKQETPKNTVRNLSIMKAEISMPVQAGKDFELQPNKKEHRKKKKKKHKRIGNPRISPAVSKPPELHADQAELTSEGKPSLPQGT